MSDRKLAVKALQKAQSEFETPEKDATNAYLHNKYASLKSCLNTLKPTLHQNGFALVQEGGKDEFGHFMETKFIHETGEFFSSRIYLELDKNHIPYEVPIRFSKENTQYKEAIKNNATLVINCSEKTIKIISSNKVVPFDINKLKELI